MKITFLGSAAAQGIPMPYCNCSTCTYARENKGCDIRKRCAYLINDDLLVDMGPDLFASCALHDVNLLKTRYALVTHSHKDHFFTQNLILRGAGLRNHTKIPTLTLVGPPSVMTKLIQSGLTDEKMELERKPVLPYDKIELPPYHIRSVKATHFPEIGDAVNYIIDDGEKRILIASDTGVYRDEVWPYLQDLQLDLLVIESTRGTHESKPEDVHLSIDTMKDVVQKMRGLAGITAQTIIYATHFSHQQVPPHEELRRLLKKYGIECVHDGLELEI